jgi:cytochrome c biogenesis protein CcdA
LLVAIAVVIALAIYALALAAWPFWALYVLGERAVARVKWMRARRRAVRLYRMGEVLT